MKCLFRLFATSFAWLALAILAGAAPPSPFRVTAGMETKSGTPIVSFHFEVPPDCVLYSERLSFETSDGKTMMPLNLPEPKLHKSEATGDEKLAYDHSFSASFKLDGHLPSSLVVHLQGCSNAECFFPEKRVFNLTQGGIVAETDIPSAHSDSATGSPATTVATAAAGFQVAGRETGFLSRGAFVQFLDEAEHGHAGAGGMLARLGEFGLATTLLLIVAGGLGLNLTPCVLPLIPINLAIIGAGARASSRSRGFALGATYGAGMALVYGVLGVVVVLTGAKMGTLNSNVWFNLVIALVFVVMGLAMFDVINIDFSRFQGSSGSKRGAQKSQFVVAFSIGVMAALLAGACVAPVVISVLLMAANLYGRGVIAGLLLPFLLGVGMALPWPFAGAGLSFLPKPGKWMMKVKYGFGVLIFAFAVYYGHLAAGLIGIGGTTVVRARAGNLGQTESPETALAAALEQAKREHRPVMIDFAASWCKNCEAMDATVFPAKEVKNKLTEFVVVRYDAEKPNESPAKETLDRFGVMGLPTYVVLRPEVN